MNAIPQDSIPVVVDLDGTLVPSNLQLESFLQLLSHTPLQAFAALLSLRKGMGSFKANLASRADLKPVNLPCDERVVAFLRTEKAKGRKIYLTSASDPHHVAVLAKRFDFVDEIVDVSSVANLPSADLAKLLRERFGERGYDYVGNDKMDLAPWLAARTPMAANASLRLLAQLRDQRPDAIEIAPPVATWRTYARSLRVYQWIKNILVFLPLLAGHFFTPQAFGLVLIAALSFSFAASSAYLINDLLDLSHDREHADKCSRPLASGEMPLTHAFALIPVLLGMSGLLACAISPGFFLILATYFAVTLMYSFYLKRKVLVDVMTLACLYTIRILAGTAALGVATSSWLLGFSVFLFLCLAIIKRYVELIGTLNRVGTQASGRGYLQSDLPILSGFASASGFCAVLVLALYFNSPEVRLLYKTPELLWWTCLPMLYWICRMLLLAHRGTLHHDPVVFAVTDRTSWCVGLAILGIIALAL